MENDLKIFDNPEFGKIRTIIMADIPWFIGKDVAEALGYSNTRDALGTHVNAEDKNTVAIRDGNKGNPNVVVINESGLYSLILSSKLPSAKAFKHWVTSEVLPSIRKTGQFTVPDVYAEVKMSSQRSDIMEFKNPSIGRVRVLMKDGKPWFIAKDITDAIGYGGKKKDGAAGANAVHRHVDPADISTTPMPIGSFMKPMLIINAKGVAALTSSTRLPASRELDHWITYGVLPRLGQRETVAEQLSQPAIAQFPPVRPIPSPESIEPPVTKKSPLHCCIPENDCVQKLLIEIKEDATAILTLTERFNAYIPETTRKGYIEVFNHLVSNLSVSFEALALEECELRR